MAFSSSKRRHHSASPFYLYCKEFVDECLQTGRRFRTAKQGFEAAGLHWATLSEEDKQLWRERCREERRRCAEEGSTRLKIRNGDRGDPNSDPTALGLIKDAALKSSKDVDALTDKWTWLYEVKSGVGNERFLIVNARTNGGLSPEPFTALAVVEFSLNDGIVDQFHANFTCRSFNGPAARYESMRRVLQWPVKLRRSLREVMPVFFAPTGQMSAVFNALTYVDDSSRDVPNWGGPDEDFSLARNLANVDDLWTALCEWFDRSPVLDEATAAGKSQDEDCLNAALECASRIVAEFSCK